MQTKSIIYHISTDEMVSFYNENPDYGTKKNPFPADSFYLMKSSNAVFCGPKQNILFFEDETIYDFILEDKNGNPIELHGNETFMEIEMLNLDEPSKKWNKIFKINKEDTIDGKKLKVKKTNKDKDLFELTTLTNPVEKIRMKYSFTFEFNDEEGAKRYAIIDPLGMTKPPLP